MSGQKEALNEFLQQWQLDLVRQKRKQEENALKGQQEIETFGSGPKRRKSALENNDATPSTSRQELCVAQTEQTVANLMDLPTEIRQMIFGFSIHVPLSMLPTPGIYEQYQAPKTLVRLCKLNHQIRREMLHVIRDRHVGRDGLGGMKRYSAHHQAMRNREELYGIQVRGEPLGALATANVLPAHVPNEVVDNVEWCAREFEGSDKAKWFTSGMEQTLLVDYIIKLMREERLRTMTDEVSTEQIFAVEKDVSTTDEPSSTREVLTVGESG